MGDDGAAELAWLKGGAESALFPGKPMNVSAAAEALVAYCEDQKEFEPFFNAASMQNAKDECPYINPYVKDDKKKKNKRPLPAPKDV